MVCKYKGKNLIWILPPVQKFFSKCAFFRVKSVIFAPEMNLLRAIYRTLRGILFTAIIFVAVVYLALYVLLTIPAVQNSISRRAETELEKFLGTDVRIGHLIIKPFNEVVIKNFEVMTPQGEKCLSVETVGAGINLWRLIKERRIEISYGEIIGLDARISQAEADEPLNIKFLIDAFAPKDKTKPPTKFDLNLRNVVIRKSSVSFDRLWQPRLEGDRRTDFNHLRLWNLRADLMMPRLANDDFVIDLRRLSFHLSGGLDVEKLALRAHITPNSISVNNFIVQLPQTEIRPSDIVLSFNGYNDLVNSLRQGKHNLVMVDNTVTPADFGWLLPQLRDFTDPLSLSIEASGNLNDASLREFSLEDEDAKLALSLQGSVANAEAKEDMQVNVDQLKLAIDRNWLERLASLLPAKSDRLPLDAIGNLSLSLTGNGYPLRGSGEIETEIKTSSGSVSAQAKATGIAKRGNQLTGHVAGNVETDHLDLGSFISDKRVGILDCEVAFDGHIKGKDSEGSVTLNVEEIEYLGDYYGGIAIEASKEGKDISLIGAVNNDLAKIYLDADGCIDGENSWIDFRSDIRRMRLDLPGVAQRFHDYTLSVRLDANLEGDNIDNLVGDFRMTDLELSAPGKKDLTLDHLILRAREEDHNRSISIASDLISGDIRGDFKVAHLPVEAMSMVSKVVPSLVKAPTKEIEFDSDVSFNFEIAANNTLPEFFNLPFRLLVPVSVQGSIFGSSNTAGVTVNIPYLQQGKNKLVSATSLRADLDGEASTLNLEGTTTFPVKKGDLKLNLHVFGQEDNIFTDINWLMPDNDSFKGELSLGAELSRNELSATPEVALEINPSVFDFGTARWNIDRGRIDYHDNQVLVDGVKIWHDSQFVEIDGLASPLPTDSVTVRLAQIDVGYIFDTLNINYVSFGGTATGEVTASGALSKQPIAATDNLFIESLSYNGAVLGDANIRSSWNNDEKEVTILADIMGHEKNLTKVDGGIWVTRDSLSFDLDANRVPVSFLTPFMSAFTTDISGRASGKAKLYGSFSDIDLVGRIFADSINMRLDYTNVYYHGSDSVYLDPGKITIPSFRLYDTNGNSALLTGELTHRYFHDPVFDFRVSDVDGMLCYNTNSTMNPDWYGTLYGKGGAVVRGFPGLVSISVDMTAVGNSSFTFVLNDTQAAADYKFLTFSDRRKEEAERLQTDSVADIISAFRKKIKADNSIPSKFQMDIRGTVTPSTLMTLVMDPVAGDKITARGNGNIQVDYDSESDAMQMFGKYILEEGNYNFSLQDLILRDFNIRQGSSISFNGDPLNANLDITASYRVNTNLSDLDKSFSTDRDLNRTNVPVDALLIVSGEMQHPDITFDIELPTLTQDVERKVKSIISTDDMMSRQIIYLLALNRFYTPEYMGSSSNGGELASVASSTLSSQLSNMLGQLTDKLSVSPSFRSDKGDFSDIEVDVALSSRLLNNRLLINGNFGYRDPSTSSTTFVGDFDIEYLLSRSGNLRLKAYNHFNDQNYYLRQALTTQGLGVVYRREFDNPFSFLRRKKKQTAPDSEKPAAPESDKENKAQEATDSIKQ